MRCLSADKIPLPRTGAAQPPPSVELLDEAVLLAEEQGLEEELSPEEAGACPALAVHCSCAAAPWHAATILARTRPRRSLLQQHTSATHLMLPAPSQQAACWSFWWSCCSPR